MDKPNPFKRVPGGRPPLPASASDLAPAAPGGQDLPDPPPGALCPFMGAVPVPMINPQAEGMIARPGFNPLDAIQTGIAFQACQGDKCRLWDAGRGECALKLAAAAQVDAAQALADLKVLLTPLANYFGGAR